jgi:predicted nucleic acid-binding protein
VILADVNVLVYAFRNDLAQHAVCKPWLGNVVTGDLMFGMSPPALMPAQCAIASASTAQSLPIASLPGGL